MARSAPRERRSRLTSPARRLPGLAGCPSKPLSPSTGSTGGRGAASTSPRRTASAWRRLALLPVLALLLGTLGPFAAAPASADVLVSNIGQTVSTTSGTGSSSIAQGFTTGSATGGYTLSNIEADLATTISAAQRATIRAELWSAATGGGPDSKVASLTVPSTISTTADRHTVAFAAPTNTTLTASTTYYLVIYTVGAFSVEAVTTASDNEDSGGQTGWSISNSLWYYTGDTPGTAGSNWAEDTFTGNMRIRVNGSAKTTTTPTVFLSLSVSPNPVTEGSSVTVRATLSSALSSNVTIPVTVTRGTAESGDVGTLTSISISSGSTSGAGTLTTAQDPGDDDETFTVALGSPLPAGVTAGSRSSVTVTILDDERVRATNAHLSALTATMTRFFYGSDDAYTPLALSPSFDRSTTAYAASVDPKIRKVKLTPTVEATGRATVQVGRPGQMRAVESGRASEGMGLAPDANAFEVVVMAEDGATRKTYTVTVTKSTSGAPPPVTPVVTPPVTPPPPPPPPVTPAGPTLSALSLSAGWLAFAPQTSAYAVEVPYAVAGVTVTPAANDGAATVAVNGEAVGNGEASAPVALAAGGETVIEVVVTAPGGATRTYTVTVTRGPAEVALLPAASGALHGFVRVVNESDEAGEVQIRAFDDAGEEYGPVTLTIEAGAAVQLSARDLESGNPDKGLTGSTGPGQGRWRLVFESELGLRVLGYVRTRAAEGFPNAVHDVVAESRPSAEDYRYEVVFFNPASNANQTSVLRLVNRSASEEAAVTITGTDDAGEAGEEAVTLTLSARAARRLSAPALESGDGEGLDGMLGDGAGKWRLRVDSDRPLGVMSLMGSLDGHLTNLSTAPDGVKRLWLLPSAADTVRYGFVRIVNEGGEAGEVRIRAFDDTGEEHGPLTLALEAGAAVQLGSSDLESGNAAKGLTGATGPGQGRWRLAFERDPGVRVYGYVRNRGASGFPAAMHDVVAESQPEEEGYRYEVAFFNPASNANQASVLRLVNRSASEEAEVTITGTDDAGRAGDAAVTLTLPAGASRMLGAPALESGEGEGLDGALGDGAGKWRLRVDSDRPLAVMSLMRSLDGHLANLSTAPPASR